MISERGPQLTNRLLDILHERGNCIGRRENMVPVKPQQENYTSYGQFRTASRDYGRQYRTALKICGQCAVSDVCAVYCSQVRVGGVNATEVVGWQFMKAIRQPGFDIAAFTQTAEQDLAD